MNRTSRDANDAVTSVGESSAQSLITLASRQPLTLPEMLEWGREFGRSLPVGSVVALHGELGAGKTSLVRAICDGLGVEDLSVVTSPTFALVHEYESPMGLVVHADLYRLRNEAELEQLGWDDLAVRASVMLIEWPERAAELLPAETLRIELSHVPSDESRRRIHGRS